MRRTLGAPSGATRGLGKSGLDCCHVCPICPANGVAERGKTVLDSSPAAPDMDCPCADADSVIIRAVAARRLRRIIRTSISRPSSHDAGSAFMLTPGALRAAAPSTSIPCRSPVPTAWDVRTDDARVSGTGKLDLGPTTGHVENVPLGHFRPIQPVFVRRLTSGLKFLNERAADGAG